MVLFCKPRVCGEKGVYAMLYTGLWGSPPHVRGKVLVPAIKRFAQRITPAYAGKRSPPLFPLRSPEDHPRMCGEKLSCLLLQWCFLGSPPRMRGKVRAQCVQRDCVGITPAYAGKRDLFPAGKTAPRDHPRVCGEKAQRARGLNLILGSPPHVRGKDTAGLVRMTTPRITPACAGKSQKIQTA